MNFSPKSVTLVESDIPSVAQYQFEILGPGNALLAQANYNADPSGTTVVNIGSNGLLDGLESYHIRIRVTEINPIGEMGPPQFVLSSDPVPTDTFIVYAIPNGAENITIQL